MISLLGHAASRLSVLAYRRAMMSAIDLACESDEIWGRCNRTDGLRAVRAFERLNGRPFDPRNPVSREIVRGTGPKHRRALFGRAPDRSQGAN